MYTSEIVIALVVIVILAVAILAGRRWWRKSVTVVNESERSLLGLTTERDSIEPENELNLDVDQVDVPGGAGPTIDPPIGNGGPPDNVSPPAPNPGSDDENYSGWRLEVRKNGILYLLCFYAAIFAVLLVTSLFFSTWTFPLWALVLVAAGCFTYYMYEQITPRVHVLLTLAGMIVLPLDGKKTLVPGPHLIPPPVKMITYPNTEILLMFGTADADSFDSLRTAHPDATLYEDRNPVRISWNERASDRGGNQRERESLAGVLTTDPPLYVILQIRIPEDYYLVVGESLEEGLRRIRIVMVRALQEIAGTTSAAMALEQASEINLNLKRAVEHLVGDRRTDGVVTTDRKSWGVDIIDAAFVTPGYSHDVNSAFAKRTAAVIEAEGEADATVTTSVAEKDAARNRADAARYTAEQEGLGEKAKTIAIGQGQAQALRDKGRAASTKGGRLVLQTEALRDAVEGGNVTLMPIDTSGLTSIVSAVAAGQQVVKANDKPK